MMPKLPPSTPVYTSLLSWKSDPYYTQEQLIAYARAVAEAKDAEIAELRAERDALQSRIDEAREIYAGMDGFIPQTAPEGYLLRIVKQMYDAAMAEKRGT